MKLTQGIGITFRMNLLKIMSGLSFGLIFLFLTSLGLTANAAAQQLEVSGKVVAADDQSPIVGATVVIKGTTNGTTTDIDGNFSIDASAGDVLLVSFIGYQDKEVSATTENLTIELEEAVTDLDEIVVIGYGVQKKKLVTGATTQVQGDAIENRNQTNALQAMQGQAAGVNITSSSGQPGEGMKVSIRGVGTIGNSGPLYIVDGVQTDNIDHLNSTDIESIDVLKDAASAAIYGSRAANGVVLVTTKKGEAGTSQISFNAYYGFQNRPKDLDLLDAREYGMIMNEQYINSGGTPSKLPFDLNNLPAYTSDGVANTDWLDEMFVDNAVTQNYSLNASGGTEKSVYSMSLSYTGQEGIVGGADNSNYERYNARINTEHNMLDGRVVVGQHLTFSYSKQNGIGVGGQYDNSLRGAFNVSPLMPVYDDEGNFFNAASNEIVDQNGNPYWHDAETNPYASMVLNNKNTSNNQKLIGDVYAEIELLDNLKFKSTFGIDYHAGEERTYDPIYELSIYTYRNYDAASQNLSKGMAWNFDNVLTYDLTTGMHKFNAMAGMSSRTYNGSWMNISNADVAFSDLEHAWIDNTNNQEWAKMSIGGGPDDEDKLLSYFGRVQYSYNETYLMNLTFRADGSSKFAKGNRWGYFPSVSTGWVMTNEDFMSGMSSIVDFFKLRVSWGQNGNQNISANQYMAPIKFTQATYNFGDTEGVNTTGSYPSRLANEDLRWETSEQLNIGFDANTLDNNLNINFDWYRKSTKDWLIVAPVLATAGTDAPYVNGGNVTNTGVELVMAYYNNIGDFNYNVSINGSYNKNEVTDIPTDDGIIHGATNTLYNNSAEFYRAEAGYPIGYFWGYETNGIFQNTSEVDEHVNSDGSEIQPKAKPGDLRYVDQNDDGRINDEDKTMVGDPNPDFMYGLTMGGEYKAFDFYINANGVAGNQIVQSYRSHTDKYSNYTAEILDRWRGEGTSNTIPRVTNANVNYQFSDLFVKDGAYLRISNVSVGFDFAKVFNLKYFSKCRVYASVQNLYTFTGYNGMDPEVGFGYDNGETDKFSSGIDLGYYPRPRTILFGVNLNF